MIKSNVSSVAKKKKFKLSVNHFHPNTKITWKDFHEWLLKYLTFLKEMYVPFSFFINVLAILLINWGYLCSDKFCPHHSLCSFYITSSCRKIKALVLCTNHPLGNRLQYFEHKSMRQEDGTFGLSSRIFCPVISHFTKFIFFFRNKCAVLLEMYYFLLCLS